MNPDEAFNAYVQRHGEEPNLWDPDELYRARADFLAGWFARGVALGA